MLSSEVTTIRAMATYSHEMYTRIMRPLIDAKEREPLATVAINVDDPDFPTHIIGYWTMEGCPDESTRQS